MPNCPCRSGDARNPAGHNNQVRAGRCECYCHTTQRPVATPPAPPARRPDGKPATDAAPVRAKDVMIDQLCRARCHRADCTYGEGGVPWTGPLRGTWPEASLDRETHLAVHAAGQP